MDIGNPEEQTAPLFSITLYRDGSLHTTGGKDDRLPGILRIIADALEDGHTQLAIVDSDG